MDGQEESQNVEDVRGSSGGGDNSASRQSAPTQPAQPPADDPQVKFVSQVLRSTETVWTSVFEERGQTLDSKFSAQSL
jgi:predicted metalloprotease